MPTFPPLPPLTVGDQTIDGAQVRSIRAAIIELRNASLDAARFDYAVPLSLAIAILNEVATAMGNPEPKPKPRYDRDEPAKPDPRPAQCRFRLRDEGQPYPKSGCQACGRNAATGGLGDRCHYIERNGAPGV